MELLKNPGVYTIETIGIIGNISKGAFAFYFGISEMKRQTTKKTAMTVFFIMLLYSLSLFGVSIYENLCNSDMSSVTGVHDMKSCCDFSLLHSCYGNEQNERNTHSTDHNKCGCESNSGITCAANELVTFNISTEPLKKLTQYVDYNDGINSFQNNKQDDFSPLFSPLQITTSFHRKTVVLLM